MDQNDFGIFSFDTDNIGDDMQALSMLLHLKRLSGFLNRDKLPAYSGKHLNFVTTAAFSTEATPPSDEALSAFLWGMCVGTQGFFKDADWMAYFRERQPFGARDQASTDLLNAYGIDAYWSGCITLHLGSRLPPVPMEQRKGIYFFDVKRPEMEKYVPRHIARQAIHMSTFVPPSIRQDQLARLAYLTRLVDVMRHARMIVTRRLHVALPCVGMGTPVIALPVMRISKPRYRFSGFDTFLPVRYNDELGGDDVPFDWDNPQPAVIPDHIKDSHARLCDHLDAHDNLSTAIVPDSSKQWPSAENIHYRFDNPCNDCVPGDVRLILGDRIFTPRVYRWDNRHITLEMQAFLGFDRIEFEVEVQNRTRVRWSDRVKLSDLNGRFVPVE